MLMTEGIFTDEITRREAIKTALKGVAYAAPIVLTATVPGMAAAATPAPKATTAVATRTPIAPATIPPATAAPATAVPATIPPATAAPATAVPATAVSGALDVEEAAFLPLINNYRAQKGLGSLTLFTPLIQSSKWMSADMAAKGYFSHTDSLGRDLPTRLCAFGYCGNAYKGENLAAGYATAQETFAQWQGSPVHNADMLNPNFTLIGIGRASGGPYQWYWTTDFGSVPQ